MTRFFYQGESILSWCHKNNVSYHNVYRRMDDGMKPEHAIREAIKIRDSQRNHRSHPKLFYQGKPVVDIFTLNSYRKIIKRKNKGKGMSLEKAIEMGYLTRRDGVCL